MGEVRPVRAYSRSVSMAVTGDVDANNRGSGVVELSVVAGRLSFSCISAAISAMLVVFLFAVV